MEAEVVKRIPGAVELVAWFGRFPRFHDANVLDFELRGDGSGRLRLHGWNMTDKIDKEGYFVLNKDFVADLTFDGTVEVQLGGFLPGCVIVSDLEIKASDDGFEIVIESSYGFSGKLNVKNIRVEFQPGKPE